MTEYHTILHSLCKSAGRYATWFVRVCTYGLIVFAVLAIISYRVARSTITPVFIKEHLIAIVQQQTGGKLMIQSVEFTLDRELSIKQVTFYPPKTEVGYIDGGMVAEQPLAAIDSISIKYDLKRLLAAQIFLEEAKINNPSFYFESVSHQSNFAPIGAYRAKKYPAEPKVTKAQEPTTLPKWLFQVPLANLFMPVNIILKNIGFEGLRVRYQRTTESGQTTTASISGISLKADGSWFGRRSSFGLAIASSFDHPMRLVLQENGVSNVTSDIAQLHTVRITNFQDIAAAFALLSPKTTVQQKVVENLGASLQTFVQLSTDLRKIKIKDLHISAVNALSYQLAGDLEVVDVDKAQFSVAIASKGELLLAQLQDYIQPFIAGLELGGNIYLKKANVTGQFALNDISAMKPEAFPSVNIETILSNVSVSKENLASLVNLSGTFELHGLADAALQDYQVNLKTGMHASHAKVYTSKNSKQLSSHLHEAAMQSNIKLLVGQQNMPHLRFSLDIPSIQARVDEHVIMDESLTMKTNASLARMKRKFTFDNHLKFGDLLSARLNLTCLAQCDGVKVEQQTAVSSLDKLWTLAQPMLEAFVPTAPTPDNIAGSIDAAGTIEVSGLEKFFWSEDATRKLDEIAVKFKQDLTFKNWTVAMSQLGLKVNNFNSTLKVGGNPQDIHMQSLVDIDSVGLQQAADISADLNGVHLHTSVKLLLPQLLKRITTQDLPLQKLLKDTKVLITHQTELDEISSNIKKVQETLQGVVMEATVDISDGQLVKISPIKAHIAALGFHHDGQLTIRLNDQFLPSYLALSATTRLAPEEPQNLPMGILLGGSLANKLDISVQDMNAVTIDSTSTLDKFELQVENLLPEIVPDLAEQFAFLKESETLVQVKNATGVIPVKQRFIVGNLGVEKRGVSPSLAVSESQNADAAKETYQNPILSPEEAVEFYESKYSNDANRRANVRKYVDYSGMANLMAATSGVHVDQIMILNVAIDHLDFGFEVSDRGISVNQFMLHTLGGVVQGSAHFDFDFDDISRGLVPRYLRLATHLTNIDTNLLVRKHDKRNVASRLGRLSLFEEPKISGTLHVSYDVKNNDLGGNIEITSIGKEQMRTFLRYIDPYNQNASIRDMRRALLVGDVRHVAIPVKNGSIDLAVDVRAVGIPIPLPKLSRFPLSQMLANALNAQRITNQ